MVRRKSDVKETPKGGKTASGKGEKGTSASSSSSNNKESKEPANKGEEEINEKGEAKIRKDGVLLGDRKYRCRTYLLPRDPDNLYILSSELCKVLGFRDSYVFFRKNHHIPRFDATEDDKDALVNHGLVSHHFKSNRVVPLVLARSIFKDFGHLIIRNGKPVEDDYWEDGSRGQSNDPDLRAYRAQMDQEEKEALDSIDLNSTFVKRQPANYASLFNSTNYYGGAGVASHMSSTSAGLNNIDSAAAQVIRIRPINYRPNPSPDLFSNDFIQKYTHLFSNETGGGGGGGNNNNNANGSSASTADENNKKNTEVVDGVQVEAVTFASKDMAKTALSAAEYNARLRSARPLTFYDIHTNTEQYPRLTQASIIGVQQLAASSSLATSSNMMDIDSSSSLSSPKRQKISTNDEEEGPTLLVESKVFVDGAKSAFGIGFVAGSEDDMSMLHDNGQWIHVNDTPEMDLYPLAIDSGQHRCTASIYTSRFSTQDAMELHRALDPSIELASTVNDQGDKGVDKSGSVQSVAASVENVDSEEDDGSVQPSFACGIPLKKGRAKNCPVLVKRKGEMCLRHKQLEREGKLDYVVNDSVATSSRKNENLNTPCVHCGEEIPPKAKEQELETEHNPQSSSSSHLLLFCQRCGQNHHASCVDLEDPVVLSKVQDYEWHCPNCKDCVVCEELGDDEKMLFCDTCDRGYHMYCVKPPLKKIPEGYWLCKECTVCVSCAKTQADSRLNPGEEWKHALTKSTSVAPAAPTVTSSGRRVKRTATAPVPEVDTTASDEPPVYICTYCSHCYEIFERSEFCPCCMKLYDVEDEESNMVCCDTCDRWIHVGCDPELTEEVYDKLMEQEDSSFKCILCKPSKLAKLLESTTTTNPLNDRRVEGKLHKLNGKVIAVPPLKNFL